MTADTALPEIEDPFLLSVLRTNHALRSQTLALLDIISTSPQREEAQQEPSTAPSPLSPERLEVVKAQKAVSTLLAALRGQNWRLANLARDTKTATSASRAEVDHLHLSLQNLYYEQRHLVGEIAGCEGYPHAYAKLPLISEDEFLTRFPEWGQKRVEKSGRDSGEEGLMRARIEDERREREELQQRVQALSKKRLELMQENAKRKQELGKLDKDLEAFIQVSQDGCSFYLC